MPAGIDGAPSMEMVFASIRDAMPRELERDLGLISVIAISVGAMVGSGIFILPALALELAGPLVIVAYFLAGLVVLPAALSKAEMATAMPQAGGDYIYIERSMGPILGTVAGLGTWFSLAFKGALALVGGAPYLVFLLDIPAMPVAVGLAVVLIAVNLLGAKQTGQLQVVIVAIMLMAMVWFVGGSIGKVEAAGYDDFYSSGVSGLLAAAGFVFISYAGVTKVASIAEEVKNPGRNLPLGLLVSLGFTTALYVLVVIILVGVTPSVELAGSVTPIADVAEVSLGSVGVIVVIVAAILALVSTANAGLLSASRYPFAMSRDKVMPERLSKVSERFGTPSVAILLTGGVMLLLVVGVPIMEIAKLGSAFQILVFVMINVAVMIFRQSDVEGYAPEFRDPLYPWSQSFGIVGGLVLLTQMGWLPVIGAVVIVGVSLAWYLLYVRPRVWREGVARGELRRRAEDRAVERTRSQLEAFEDYDVLVAVTDETSPRQETAMLDIASTVATAWDGEMTVVRFDRVADQLPLAEAIMWRTEQDQAFEARMGEFRERSDVRVEYGEIVSHDLRRSVVNFVEHHRVDLLVAGNASKNLWDRLFGSDSLWMSSYIPCHVVLVDSREHDLAEGDEIALVTDEGPFESVEVEVADMLAQATGRRLVLVQGIPEDAPEEQRTTVREYHREVADLCTAPVDSRVVRGRQAAVLGKVADESDLVIVHVSGSPAGARRRQKLIDEIESPTLVVRSKPDKQPGWLGRLFERFAF